MKKIILCFIGIFTLFSLSSCKSQCNCLACQEYLIVDKETGVGIFPSIEDHTKDEERQYYRFIFKNKTIAVDEETYNSYKIGELYEGKKD